MVNQELASKYKCKKIFFTSWLNSHSGIDYNFYHHVVIMLMNLPVSSTIFAGECKFKGQH